MRTKRSARRGTVRRRPGTTPVSIPFSSPSPVPNHAQADALSCPEDETLVVPDTYGDSQGIEQSRDQDVVAGAEKVVSPLVSEGRCPPDEKYDDQVLDKSSCLNCSEGGELLVCSENSCPIVIHERCLGCEPWFNESGSFYCPYCTYKGLAVKVWKLRKKAMLAEKKLGIFLDLGEDDNEDDNNKKEDNDGIFQRSEPVNQLHESITGSDDLSAGHERNKRKSKPVLRPTVESSRQGDSSRGLDDEVSVRAQTSEGTVGPPVLIPQIMPQPLRALSSWTLVKRHFPADQTNAQPHHARNRMEATSPSVKRKRLYWRPEEEEMLKAGLVDLCFDSSFSIIWWMNLSIMISCIPFVLNEKRLKELHATASSLWKWQDNEIRPCVAWLKEIHRDEEAVRSFQNNVNKNLPWRKILEYGCLVFDKTRTPSDLKDKWKTMTRRRK